MRKHGVKEGRRRQEEGKGKYKNLLRIDVPTLKYFVSLKLQLTDTVGKRPTKCHRYKWN